MSTATASAGTPTILVVLGMHRAGTSAVTGALSMLGYSLGKALVPAAADNPLGYFENAEAVDINEALLLELGRGWDDLRPLPAGWMVSGAAAEARRRIEAWIEDEVGGVPGFVLKDPRLCLTFPLWREVFLPAGIDTRVVLAHREMPEIVASLVKRDGLSSRHALLLGLRHVLHAELATRGLLRVASHYDRLLAAPAEELPRLLATLGQKMPPQTLLEAAADSLDTLQRHHRGGVLPQGLRDLDGICTDISLGARSNGACKSFPKAFLKAVEKHCVVEARDLQPDADRLNLCRWNSRLLSLHVRQMDGAVVRLSDGAEKADRLALERLSALEMQEARLAATEQALAAADRIALERLSALEMQEARLAATEQALAAADRIALERLSALEMQEARLAATEQALAAADRLALERLSALEMQEARLAATEQALAAAYRESAVLSSEVKRMGKVIFRKEALMDTMKASWSWRLTRPLRWLSTRLRRAAL